MLSNKSKLQNYIVILIITMHIHINSFEKSYRTLTVCQVLCYVDKTQKWEDTAPALGEVQSKRKS